MILQSATTISTLLESVTTIVTASISWITSFVGEITSQPLLLMFVIFGFISFPVGVRSNLAAA